VACAAVQLGERICADPSRFFFSRKRRRRDAPGLSPLGAAGTLGRRCAARPTAGALCLWWRGRRAVTAGGGSAAPQPDWPPARADGGGGRGRRDRCHGRPPCCWPRWRSRRPRRRRADPIPCTARRARGLLIRWSADAPGVDGRAAAALFFFFCANRDVFAISNGRRLRGRQRGGRHHHAPFVLFQSRPSHAPGRCLIV